MFTTLSDRGFPDLRAFLDQLRRDGDLAVVDAPVDARLEAAEIHRRVIAAGGPALLFTNVKGARLPARRRTCSARAAGPRWRSARGRCGSSSGSRALAEDAAAADARASCGARATCVGEALRIGTRAPRRSGPVTEVVTTRRPRSTACPR